MANQEVKVYFKVEGLDGYISDLGDLQKALGKVDESTTEATAATDKLLKSMDDVGNTEAQLDALEGGIKVLAGSAELAAGAIGLLGLEGNQFFESVQENVVNILALGQGAVDLSEGYSKLKKNTELATIANKALNAVAKANPYVLLASALIAVGGALLLYRKNAKEAAEEEAKASAEAFKTNLELRERARLAAEVFDAETRRIRITKEVKDLDDDALKGRIAQNEFDTQAARDRVAQINERLRQAGEITVSDEYLNNLQEEYNDALADYNRIQKNTNSENAVYNTELDKRNNLTLIAIQREEALAAARRQANAEILDEQFELEEQLYRDTLSVRELAFRDLEDEYYERLNLANGNAELEAAVVEQFEKDKAALREKYRLEDAAAREKVLNDTFLNSLNDLERQEVALMQAADAQVGVLDALLADKIISEQEYADAVYAINKKLQEDITKLNKETAEENAASNLQIAQASLQAASTLTSALQNLSDVTTEEKLKNVEKGSKAEEEILKQQFERNKKFQIAQATIGIAQSVISALSSAPPPANFILAAANAAAGGIQIAAIRRTTFSGGGSAPSPSNPGASINYNLGNQQAGPVIQPGQTSAGQQIQPTQTYVLASDVTNAQEAQAQIENLARL